MKFLSLLKNTFLIKRFSVALGLMKGELFYLARVIASIPGELTYQRVTNPKLTRVKEQQYATNFSGMKKVSQI